ncbi:MAG: hypothetical protein HY247_01065 [archaeon]|nr:MAG: hypothetical protein HY247_01065 [archaeon]
MPEAATDVDRLVASSFKVLDSYQLEGGESEYRVEYEARTKQSFASLRRTLAGKGLTPWLTGSESECVLQLKKSQAVEQKGSRLPVILALLTLSSVIVFSLLERIVYDQFVPGAPGYFVVLSYGGTVVALLAAREVGHRYSSSRSGDAPSTSLFIPGIPYLTSFLPTLGATSLAKKPSLNRDSLFVSRISGPLSCIALAVVLYLIGDLTAYGSSTVVQQSQFLFFNPSGIEWGIDSLLGPLAGGAASAVRLSPIADGATVGLAVGAIGLMPLAYFDGGYLSSLAWGQRASRVAGYLTIFLLFVVDIGHTQSYWALSVFALLLVGRPPQVLLLDEVSKLSNSRKWAYLAAILLLILCLPVPQDIAGFPLG